jgi:hypothetical protein
MRSKHSSFVVTFSALAACTPTRQAPKADPVHETSPPSTAGSEPEPEPEPGPEPTAEQSANPPVDAGSESPANLTSFPVPVNPRDANGRVIHKAWDGKGCFVELPFPPLLPGQQRPPGTPPPMQKMACPAALNDPAYDSCKGGIVYTNAQKSGCICFVMGNPPPIPTRMACPK